MTNHTFAGRLALGLALCCMPLMTLGCSAGDSADHSESSGKLTFALTSTTANGIIYRLRDAQFELSSDGFSQGTLSSETAPDSTTLTTNLPAGSYTATLNTAWRIEKQVAGLYETVPAVLLSSRVQSFDITAGASSAVVYEFKVAGDLVTLGGSLVVSTNVVEEQCQDDAAEQNDTLETARPITAGNGYGLAICLGDVDYFVLDNVSGKKVTVDLAFTNAQGDLDLFVLNEDGLGRGTSTSVDDGEHVAIDAFDGTRAVIYVNGFRNASNTYTLTTTVTAPPPPVTPEGWTCNANFFGSGDGCDCGCAVVDPDCSGGAATICDYDNCPAPTHAQPGNNTQCI